LKGKKFLNPATVKYLKKLEERFATKFTGVIRDCAKREE